MKYEESANQIAFVQWCKLKGYPYNLIFAIENEGIKTPQAGARAKQMGKRAGVCDLFLPVKSGIFNGLFIEMKSKKGKVSANQDEFIKDMRKEDYNCRVCHSIDEAIKYTTLYIENGI